MKIATPTTDAILKIFLIKTKEGLLFNDIIKPGQKEMMECILNRQAPDGSGRKRVHITATTRYGKSLAIGAATAIRAATKKEPWAIVAPSTEQAQIIMDYVIYTAVNDPILSQLLKDRSAISAERLTQRRSRTHITFLNGGEVRVFGSKQTMGFGSPNLIEDEAGLITNKEDSKAFRMLGDSPDNFNMKIGNPWDSIDAETGEEHHFYQSFINEDYYTIDIDVHRGIREGRFTEAFHQEVKGRPSYGILYLNQFPDAQKADRQGWIPFFGHKLVKNCFVPDSPDLELLGTKILGADPADAGTNKSTIGERGMNLAKVTFADAGIDLLDFANEIARRGKDIENWMIDKQGVGAGTVKKLEKQAQYWRKVTAVNTGLPVPEDIEDHKDFLNLRSYIAWMFKNWLEQGGRLIENEPLKKQLMAIRYKNNSKGKLQIIDKISLKKRGVDDLGEYDCISHTFYPPKKKMALGVKNKVLGGVKPYAGQA